jgi:hypothetical protein
MTITEMIEMLEKLRTEHGDIRVEVRNEAGDWYGAEEVQTTYYRKPASGPEWIVFIDT